MGFDAYICKYAIPSSAVSRAIACSWLLTPKLVSLAQGLLCSAIAHCQVAPKQFSLRDSRIPRALRGDVNIVRYILLAVWSYW